MGDSELRADDERFHGTVAGKDLIELLKMLHRTCASGVLHLDAGANRASLCLDQGAIRAAFFNELSGPLALSRIIVVGQAEFRFELGTAHTVASYAVNISKDTALILATVERMLDEHVAAVRQPAPTPARPAATIPERRAATTELDPLLPTDDAPSTIRVAAFMPPEIGATIGKCELTAEIGRGASAVVYRARHRSLGLDVVVKVLMQGGDDTGQHRLLTVNEAHLLARLNHPNILRIFDFADTGLYPHLIMEHVDGPSLAALIAQHQRLEAALALPLFCQAVEGLGYAHDALGLVHCDLKPTNILLTRDYQVKVADLGLAKARLAATEFDQAFKTGTVAGTPAYIAPEQVEGGRAAADHRSDIYALGATMYHAVTGRLPFQDPDPVQMMVRRLTEAPIPPHLVHPKVDRRVSQLVMSMMARDPKNRVQTYDELLELMGDLLDYTLAADQRTRAPTDVEGKIIRRRSSFWNYVPNRLFRKTSTADVKDVG